MLAFVFALIAVNVCGVFLGYIAGVLRERLLWVEAGKQKQIVEVDNERYKVEEIT